MLRVERLSKTYSNGTFTKRRFNAVDEVSFTISPGETLGLVGASGCGKSTLARLLLSLIPSSSGKIFFQEQELTSAHGQALRELRSKMQIIFQHPESALNPRLKIYDSLIEPLRIQKSLPSRKQERTQVLSLLTQVGLDEEHLQRYPHELSGGQIQRVVLARILALQPRFIVADEPSSMLDVSVQAQILHLLKDIQKKQAQTILFISHDLALVEWMSDRIAVMYQGQLVEIGPAQTICQQPRHPYTAYLVKAFNLFQENSRASPIDDINPAHPGQKNFSGCRYAPYCPYADSICSRKPELRKIADQHELACWQYT